MLDSISFDTYYLLAETVNSESYTKAAGAASTATNIGIAAKVLGDLGRLNSNKGQVILGAAILDDILGIVVLAISLSLVETGEIEIANVIILLISAIAFILVAVLLNRYFCPIITPVFEKFKNPAALMLFAIIFLNLLSFTSIGIGLEALLGAFAAGLVLGGMSIKERLMQLFELFVYIYTTIFFMTIGARVDLNVLNPFVAENREGLVIAACLIIIAMPLCTKAYAPKDSLWLRLRYPLGRLATQSQAI